MPGGFTPPPGPAEAGVETQRSEGSAVAALARGVGVPALVATLIGLAFVVVFLDAFHAPVPHGLPVGVVGSAAQVDQVRTALDRAAPGDLAVSRLTDEAAARSAVLQRDVYAAFLPGAPARLLTAGANGQGVTMTVTQAFTPLAQQAGGQLQAEDLRPLAPGDTRGLGIFYGSFGVVLGGFLFGIQSYSAAPKLPLRWRLVSIGLFAVVSALLVTWAATVVYAALPAGFGTVAVLVGLLALSVAATAALVLRAIGSAGTFVTSLGLVILGNATSTGNLPAEYLPPWLHPLAEVLPPGVAVRALRGATYFADDGVTRALWVLGLWSVVPLALIALLDAVRRGQARPSRR
ncbi:ABC transporter permease [Modestobacter altitudinis]|uniref:ABC transporter permease n=1 Tax=Modestobacter altitudinis TaxID=2213158 RepID=UPI00110CA6C2|nr:ABC transporter permease [Modestobacter altitudinis]